MKVEVITTGTEVITGSILNTNSKYISNRLTEIGIESSYHTSVDDNSERLSSVLEVALKRVDLIITTGGLGPTDDDLTKETVAKVLGLELVNDKEVEREIFHRFSMMNHSMPDSNKKQALKPKGSIIIKNKNGTAPGIEINVHGKKIIMLPGPPKEMIPMFEDYVIPSLEKKMNKSIVTRSVNIMGIGESRLEEILKDLDISEKNFYIATFAKGGAVEVKIIAKGKDKESLTKEIDKKTDIIVNYFGQHVYGFDNKPIADIVVDLLKEKMMILSLAESCTGGLISSNITGVAGASEVFDRGIVTYSNKAKMDELGVKQETLDAYGAVSEETAYEMAKGLINKTKSDIVLSVTGIAGPGGGSEKKPVGLVYFCIMNKDNHKLIRSIFSGNRERIQNSAAMKALYEIKNFT